MLPQIFGSNKPRHKHPASPKQAVHMRCSAWQSTTFAMSAIFKYANNICIRRITQAVSTKTGSVRLQHSYMIFCDNVHAKNTCLLFIIFGKFKWTFSKRRNKRHYFNQNENQLSKHLMTSMRSLTSSTFASQETSFDRGLITAGVLDVLPHFSYTQSSSIPCDTKRVACNWSCEPYLRLPLTTIPPTWWWLYVHALLSMRYTYNRSLFTVRNDAMVHLICPLQFLYKAMEPSKNVINSKHGCM